MSGFRWHGRGVPGTVRAMIQPLPLSEHRLSTPIGEVVLLTDASGALRALDFADYDARMRRLLDRHYGVAGWSIAPAAATGAAVDAVTAYFAGDLTAIDSLPTVTGGTTFQRAVWAALRRVTAGDMVSYGDIAAMIDRPSAVRAVGMANGANPVAIVVPCHRIIGRSGALTGYAGGVERKRWLLAHERRDGLFGG
ncbi:methylated-DNA--[protein]-cysteine S-methyltransferase [Sphingomonas sp. Leaf4]|uniref:methylated-DNA--[protein]-cysteine S-methyltransferase n=1 Tax=Sphingomonas sp. Leaf4 TaxID=2876553 RepID=UPI002E7761EC|nr:methylated-DNA--[protein]-cysteine S-methyltransferase [Sphingomonas sp. Leaf4]